LTRAVMRHSVAQVRFPGPQSRQIPETYNDD
jgi:hypothetical protein